MLAKRITTALLLLPFVGWLLFLANINQFTISLSLIFTLAGWEWSRLMGLVQTGTRFAYVIVLQILMLLTLWLVPGLELWPGAPQPQQLAHWMNIHYLPMIIILLGAVWWLVNFISLISGKANWLENKNLLWARGLAGVFILIPCWVSFISLRAVDILTLPQQGGWLLLFVLLQIWAADTGAYFSGKAFGKTPLAPIVSPNKTWEGVAGGTLLAIFVGFIAAKPFGLEFFSSLQLIVISLSIVVFSIIGDLNESIYKRQQQLKDSGKILPGHGGILDRIDSITSALPIFSALYFWVL